MRGTGRRQRVAARLHRGSTLGVFCALALGCGTHASSADSPPELARQIDAALAKVQARELQSDLHTPWVILHGVIAFEDDLTVYVAERGRHVDAIEYLLKEATYEGRRIFREVAGTPRLPPRQRYFQVQDHVDQYLMAFADAGIPPNRELIADSGRTFRVADLVAAAKRDFQERQELGWTLVALSTYQSPADSWTAASGESYRVEDVVRLATQRDPRRETEGGPHHLYGIAYALQRHRRSGGLPSDAWNAAARYLREYVAIARAFQQSDGAFSGEMFRRSAPPESPRRLVSTTGHMLEWLTVALSPDELREPWVERAVNRLCETLRSHPLETFSDGGIYHAAHALRRYREAVFEPPG